MAANVITLNINSITLSSIAFTVSGTTFSQAIAMSNVVIRKYNSSSGTYEAFSSFTLTDATATSATITPTTPFVQSDSISIEIKNSDDISDMHILNFSTAISSNTAILTSDMPAINGNYVGGLSLVNEEDFSSATKTSTITLGGAPEPSKSKLELVKPYLVKYAGKTCKFIVTLNNTAGDVSNGNYEISIMMDKS